MKNTVRTSDRAWSGWCTTGVSDPVRPSLPLGIDHHHSIQIVGQNAESEPQIGAITSPQSTVAPRVLATAQADRRFLTTPPSLLASEPPLALMRDSVRALSSFIGQADPLDAGLAQQVLVGFGAKPTIGGDDVRSARDCLGMARHGSGQQAAIFRIPHVDFVVGDDPILSFREQGLVAKLRLRTQLPAANGPGLRIKDAHEPIRDRRRAADPEPRLLHDARGQLQLAPQAQPGTLDHGRCPARDLLPEMPAVAQDALR